MIDNQDFTIEGLARIYADVRLELNKLTSTDHPNIIKFLGLCVTSFSFLLEWAPKGDLDKMISKYRHAEFPICPDTVATTILQVNIISYVSVTVYNIYYIHRYVGELILYFILYVCPQNYNSLIVQNQRYIKY